MRRGPPPGPEQEQEQAMEAEQEQAMERAEALRLVGSALPKSLAGPVCSSGSAALDAALGGGLHPGLTVLAGMPGAGKTTLAAQAWRLAMERGGVEAHYFDLDTPDAAQVRARLLLGLAGHCATLGQLAEPDALDDAALRALARAAARVEAGEDDSISLGKRDSLKWPYGAHDFREFLGADVFSTMEAAAQDGGFLAYTPEAFARWERTQDDAHGMNHADVCAMWDAFSSGPRFPKLAVADYLQQIRGDCYPKDETGRIAAAVEDCRHMAGLLGPRSAVLLVSSLSRAGYANPASLAATNGSSAIEYAAEAVVTLAPMPDCDLSDGRRDWLSGHPGCSYIVAHVSKNRHGAQDAAVPLVLDGPHGRVIDVGTKQR